MKLSILKQSQYVEEKSKNCTIGYQLLLSCKSELEFNDSFSRLSSMRPSVFNGIKLYGSPTITENNYCQQIAFILKKNTDTVEETYESAKDLKYDCMCELNGINKIEYIIPLQNRKEVTKYNKKNKTDLKNMEWYFNDVNEEMFKLIIKTMGKSGYLGDYVKVNIKSSRYTNDNIFQIEKNIEYIVPMQGADIIKNANKKHGTDFKDTEWHIIDASDKFTDLLVDSIGGVIDINGDYLKIKMEAKYYCEDK